MGDQETVNEPAQAARPNQDLLVIGLTADFYRPVKGEDPPDWTRVLFLSLAEFRKQKDSLTGIRGFLLADWQTPMERRMILDEWADEKGITQKCVLPDLDSDKEVRLWFHDQISRMMREIKSAGADKPKLEPPKDLVGPARNRGSQKAKPKAKPLFRWPEDVEETQEDSVVLRLREDD